MNLTQKHLDAAVDKLDTLRQTHAELSVPTNLADKAHGEAQRLIRDLTKGFAEAMDQDLNVKLAVDGLQQKLTRLCHMKQKGMLRKEDLASMHAALRNVDQVLQVVFPR